MILISKRKAKQNDYDLTTARSQKICGSQISLSKYGTSLFVAQITDTMSPSQCTVNGKCVLHHLAHSEAVKQLFHSKN